MPHLSSLRACSLVLGVTATTLGVAVPAGTAGASAPTALLRSSEDQGTAPVDTHELFMTFDHPAADGSLDLTSTGTAPVEAVVSSSGGGALTSVRGRTHGAAVRTPRFAGGRAAEPAVIVVRADSQAEDVTSPGKRGFAFGADFALDAVSAASSTDNGDNLVQRGLSGYGDQYKIELDGGYPACRVHGAAGTVSVRAEQPVIREAWYRIRCRRDDNVLTLWMTGLGNQTTGRSVWSATGASGDVLFPHGVTPLSIGGKVGDDGDVMVGNSDQFNGLIDNVVYRLLD